MAEATQSQGSRVPTSSKVAAVMFLLASCAAAYWISQPGQDALSSNNALVVESKELDFGEVWEDSAFSWKFMVHNPTPKEINIVRFHPSCNCLAISPNSARIAPKATTQITVKLDLSAAVAKFDCGKLAQSPGESIDVSERITPETDGIGPIHTSWKVTGKVRRSLGFESRFVNFGLVKENQALHTCIKVTSGTTIDGLEAECKHPGWSTSVARGDASSEYIIRVFSQEYLAPGPFEFSTTIRPIAKSLGSPPRYDFTLRGIVVSEFRASPPALLLGPVRLGTTVRETLTLLPPNQNPFQIVDIQTDSRDTRVLLTPGFSGQDRQVSIEQLISLNGKQQRTVAFTILTSEKQRNILVFPIEYHGLLETTERK
ncbi:MAG: DUF1573 domain-containing protein [Gemmataceae bacterium]|nr:DUF1573 domain-containing protein [Gemmataceae bacterium]